MRQANTSLGSIGKDLDSALKSGEAQFSPVTTPSNAQEVFQTGRMTSCQYLRCLPDGNLDSLGVLDAYSNFFVTCVSPNWFTLWNCGYNTGLKAGRTISLLFILSQVTSANQIPLSQVSSSRQVSYLHSSYPLCYHGDVSAGSHRNRNTPQSYTRYLAGKFGAKSPVPLVRPNRTHLNPCWTCL